MARDYCAVFEAGGDVVGVIGVYGWEDANVVWDAADAAEEVDG